MAEISSYVNGPYDGVSQAPPQVRLPSACEAMEDCIAVIPNGIQKRPPFEWRAKLVDALWGPLPADPHAIWADVPRGDPALDFTLVIAREGGTSGAPKVFLFQTATWASIPMTVTPAAQAYLALNSPLPNRDLRVCSVEDTTFITNRTVATGKVSGVSPTRPFEAIIWCKLSGYARTTSVTVASPAISGGSYTASFTTGTGSNSNDPLTVGTDKLARALYDGTDPKPGNDVPNAAPLNNLVSAGFTVQLFGSLIYLSHATVDFTLGVSDDIGGTGVIPIKGSVQRFSDLPSLAVDGFTVRIAQEAAGGDSDYYVQFQANSASNVGTWKEVIAPGTPLGLDPSTMPLGLRNVDGTWTLDALPWKQRQTGTVALSPDPEFIGDQITAIGWWRGRLALISNGQVNLSASDDPYKFYTSTLAANLDSDPIGLLTPTDLKTFFKEAVIFDQRFVALGNLGQAVVSASGAVTPTETKIEPLSKSPFTDAVPVQDVNHKVYFAANRSGFMTLFELAIDRLSGLALPDEMTAAVPTYIPASVDRASSYLTDYITVYGVSGGSRFYVRTFRHSENQRVQNAWFAWNLPAGWTTAGYYFKDSVLYAALIDTAGALHAATMELAPLRPDPGGTVLTYADIRIPDTACTVTYNPATDQTTYVFPFPVTNALVASVRAPATPGYPEGYRVPIVGYGTNSVTMKLDWRFIPLWFGYRIPSYFIPSRFYKRGQDGNPERAGRLTIQRIRADVARFSFLRAVVRVKGRAEKSVEFQGHTQIGAAPLEEIDTLTIPVGGNNEQTEIIFTSDDLFGFGLLGFEWEGTWTPRAQRVT